MDHIVSFLQKGGEIVDELVHIDLVGAGLRSVFHGLIKLIKGNGTAQVVGVFLSVQIEMEGDPVDLPLGKVFRAQIGSGAAGENIISHGRFNLSLLDIILKTLSEEKL